MTCLADERFVEILDLGGLEATRPEERDHLESCDACRESWASVSSAAAVLTESRPRRAGRLGWFPLTVAAAVLLAIVGVILLKSAPAVAPKPADPIARFLEGKPEEFDQARAELRKRGRPGLLPLVEARIRHKGAARIGALQTLIHEIKAAGQDPYRSIEEHRVTVKLSRIGLKNAITLIRDPANLNIVLDPTLLEAATNVPVDLAVENGTMREVLELLCMVVDLDFDYRYGVWYLSTPAKLWAAPGAPPVPLENSWQRMPLAAENQATVDKLRSVRMTLDMRSAPLDAVLEYLADITSLKVVKAPGVPEISVELKAGDLLASNLLELLTLPRGLDVRLEGGALVVYAPDK